MTVNVLILSSHLRLGLPNGLFPSGFPTRNMYTTLPSPKRATYPAHLIFLDFTTRTILGKEYRPLSSDYIFYVIKTNDLKATKSATTRHSYYKNLTSNQIKLCELWMTMLQNRGAQLFQKCRRHLKKNKNTT